MQTIFIVDDNRTNLISAQQALEGHYKTLLVTSAQMMFDLLDKVMPDLILLDIEMPGMDGLAALMKLKEEPRFRNIPVIMLTAHGMSEVVTQCIKSGAKGFVVKPFDNETLFSYIARVLSVAE